MPRLEPNRSTLSVPRGERGFSVVEGLVAATLLMIVAVGLLPMFDRAMTNNILGSLSTQLSNASIDATESRSALPFNSQSMTLVAGTELELFDHQMTDGTWVAGEVPPGDGVRVARQVVVEQYNLSDILNAAAPNDHTFDEPLPVGTLPGQIHLKRVRVVNTNGFARGTNTFDTLFVKSY